MLNVVDVDMCTLPEAITSRSGVLAERALKPVNRHVYFGALAYTMDPPGSSVSSVADPRGCMLCH